MKICLDDEKSIVECTPFGCKQILMHLMSGGGDIVFATGVAAIKGL